jgi:hypothetical protein
VVTTFEITVFVLPAAPDLKREPNVTFPKE